MSLSAKLRSKFANPTASTSHAESAEDDDSDESDGWEAVEEAKLPSDDDDADHAGPSTSTPMEITVQITGGAKKKEIDAQKSLLAQLKKRQKEIALDIHRVHLLCSLARGFYLNDTICRSPHFLALALSCWDRKAVEKVSEGRPKIQLDVPKLRMLIAAVKYRFPLKETTSSGGDVLSVVESLENQRCSSYLELALVMALMLRSLGLKVRLIYSMQPLPVKDVKKTQHPEKRQSSTNASPYFAQGKRGKSATSMGGKAEKRKRKKRVECEEKEEDDVAGGTSDEELEGIAARKFRKRRKLKKNGASFSEKLNRSEDEESARKAGKESSAAR